MTQPDARTCLIALYAKCYPVAGKPGGLVSEEAAEFRLLAERLGVPVTWKRFDLKTWKWDERA